MKMKRAGTMNPRELMCVGGPLHGEFRTFSIYGYDDERGAVYDFMVDPFGRQWLIFRPLLDDVDELARLIDGLENHE